MVTEVLLMAGVPDLGAEGDIVKVADGYARNYLYPQKLGAPVTETTKRRLARIQQERELARKAELVAAQAMAGKLAGISCTIPVKVGQDENMYGSVTAADILESLKSQGVEDVDEHTLLLDDPIKELGVYDVQVKLHPEVSAAVKVWVVEE